MKPEHDPEQMKMFSRASLRLQAWSPATSRRSISRGQKSGMVAVQKILADVRGIAFTAFKSEDVVRHPLVQRIVDAYERHGDE